MRPQYLTTTDLAALCDVETQTVRDWATRRGLPHFRTAGGHRRFKPREVVPWLRREGFDVPPRLLVAARADESSAADVEEAKHSNGRT
jgi:excisionase family DNA binding protein